MVFSISQSYLGDHFFHVAPFLDYQKINLLNNLLFFVSLSVFACTCTVDVYKAIQLDTQ